MLSNFEVERQNIEFEVYNRWNQDLVKIDTGIVKIDICHTEFIFIYIVSMTMGNPLKNPIAIGMFQLLNVTKKPVPPLAS